MKFYLSLLLITSISFVSECAWIPHSFERPVNTTRNIALGFGGAAKNSLVAFKNMFLHPNSTIKGGKFMIQHPFLVLKHIGNRTIENYKNNFGKALGGSLFYILTLFFPLGDIVGTAADIANIDDAALIAEAAEDIEELDHFAEMDEEANDTQKEKKKLSNQLSESKG